MPQSLRNGPSGSALTARIENILLAIIMSRQVGVELSALCY